MNSTWRRSLSGAAKHCFISSRPLRARWRFMRKQVSTHFEIASNQFIPWPSLRPSAPRSYWNNAAGTMHGGPLMLADGGPAEQESSDKINWRTVRQINRAGITGEADAPSRSSGGNLFVRSGKTLVPGRTHFPKVAVSKMNDRGELSVRQHRRRHTAFRTRQAGAFNWWSRRKRLPTIMNGRRRSPQRSGDNQMQARLHRCSSGLSCCAEIVSVRANEPRSAPAHFRLQCRQSIDRTFHLNS